MSKPIPHEEYEQARKHVRRKKSLYIHFFVFLVGSVLLILLNTAMGLGEEYGNWFVWAIALWFFLWVVHFLNVYVFSRFFGKEWERKQTEKLLARHEKKVQKLEKELIDKGVISPTSAVEKKTEL